MREYAVGSRRQGGIAHPLPFDKPLREFAGQTGATVVAAAATQVPYAHWNVCSRPLAEFAHDLVWLWARTSRNEACNQASGDLRSPIIQVNIVDQHSKASIIGNAVPITP